MYKTLKSSLAACEFHGKNRRKVEQELFAGLLMITITRLFANSTPPHQPSFYKKNCKNMNKFMVNFKSGIHCVGIYLERLLFSGTKQVVILLKELLNVIHRVRQKLRPGRKYPRVSKKPRNKWVHRPANDLNTKRERSRKRRAKKRAA